jgi:hypothetical protein
LSKVSFPEYHRQLLLFFGFLGAIAIAALVLVISSPSKFEPALPQQGVPQALWPHLHSYFVVVVFAWSVVAVCSVFGSFATAILGAIREGEPLTKVERALFVYWNFTLAICILALMFAIPLTVYPSTHVGAGLIGSAEFIIGGAFYFLVYLRGREFSRQRKTQLPHQQPMAEQTPSSD